ncbi:MAG: hypothetical protein IT569_07915 [Leptospiraceae bacterium]|nr:hypothetical protein [Leptospiraceae bacterium]
MSHRLEDISKDTGKNQWKCFFDNGKEFYFDRVILTAPLPKALACLKSSKCMSEWEDFISPYVEYKTSIIIAGLWKELPEIVLEKIRRLGQITLFQKNEDAEFISIESLKNNESGKDLIILIQFSQAFSSRNLERWVMDNRFPTDLAKRTSNFFFRRFFSENGITEMAEISPDDMYAFRKRYAAPDNSLWEKEKICLDSKPFSKYLELGKKHEIWLAGDWVFGPRISRCALGASFLASRM